MSLENGKTYKITNAKAGTVLDLSGGENMSPITGYAFNGGANQKWVAEQQDYGRWRLRNAETGLYIGFDGEQKDGTPIRALTNATVWDIRPDEKDSSTLRAYVAGTNYCLDLSDHGNPTPGTPVTLWTRWAGTNQTWRFEEV